MHPIIINPEVEAALFNNSIDPLLYISEVNYPSLKWEACSSRPYGQWS